MSKGNVAMVPGWWVTVLSWIALQGPEEKGVVWALQSNLCRGAGLFTIFAKSLIAWETNSHSSAHGAHPANRSQRTPAREPHRKTMLALPLPACCSLLGHHCVHTHVGALAEEPSSSHEHRFISQEHAKTCREEKTLKIGLPSYFCPTTISFPCRTVCIPFFLHIK